MGNFGPAEMLVIGVFALLVFGPQKLPEMARPWQAAPIADPTMTSSEIGVLRIRLGP